MIILNTQSGKIYLYPIGKAKGALNNHRKPQFVGIITFDEDKLTINNFSIKKNGKRYTLSKEKLLGLLNKQNIIIKDDDELAKRFMERLDLKFKEVILCEECIKNDIVTILSNKSKIEEKDSIICEDCLDNWIKDYLKLNGYNESTLMLFKKIYEKVDNLEEVYDIIDNDYNPVENETLTLFDTIEQTKEEYEKIGIEELEIPNLFKSILKKDIEYLLPVQTLSLNEGLLDDVNQLIVSATASGKTLIAELAGIPKAMDNQKFIYLSPQVSLANQKYRDFKEKYSQMGLKVVIRVGSNRLKAKE